MKHTPPLLLALALAACAGADTTTITATVRDASGEPVPGLGARLLSSLAGTMLEATTDSAGIVTWTVPAGGPASLGIGPATGDGRTGWGFAALLLDPGARSYDVLFTDTLSPPALAPTDPSTASARWGRIFERLRAQEWNAYEAYRAWVAAGQKGERTIVLGAWPDSLRRVARTDPDARVRAAAWLALLRLGTLGADFPDSTYDAALAAIPPASPVWAYQSSVLSTVPYFARRAEGAAEEVSPTAAKSRDALAEAGAEAASGQEDTTPAEVEARAGRAALAERRADEYLRRVSERNPASAARAAAIGARFSLARDDGRQEEAVALYDQLEAEYPESAAYAVARMTPPGSAVEPGSPAPDVAFPPLEKGGEPVRPADLAGRVWLVDFWATWCVPCVADMPTLHAAYRDFHDRGFEIVSVSFDDSRGDVREFRRKWPMPWIQSFAGADSLSGSALTKAWGVVGLPHPVLVGRDGKVIAVDQGLRGEDLEKTLARVMGGAR